MFETIELTIEANRASISLSRPEVRNAFNARMIAEIAEACELLRHRDEVRAVLLTGSGLVFSAGADVGWMRDSLELTLAENERDAQRLSDMFHALDSLPQPVVGRVHGAALGGGMGLIACCDVVVSAADAVFGFTETKLGIVPAVISRFVEPKIGLSWSRALFPTGERFGADVAARIGLVHWVAEPDQLDFVVNAKMDDLLTSGPIAVREAKALAREVAAMEQKTLRDATAARIARLRAAPEGQEGLRAFLEKRKPSWRIEHD
jgi:methylglutaconyl-CoA hydratase